MVLVACGGGGGTGTTSSGSTVLKIGADDSLSGAYSPYGTPAVEGMRMAVDAINQSGGFTVGSKKYTLELDVRDNRSDAATATAGVTELVRDIGVKYLLGPTVGTAAGPTAPVAADSKVLQLSPATAVNNLLTADNVKAGGQYHLLFHNLNADKNITPLWMQGIKKYLPNASRVAYLWPNDANAKANLPGYTTAFQQAGFTVVKDVRYDPTTTDFTPYLTDIKNAKVDILLISYVLAQATAEMRQASELDAVPAFAVWNLTPNLALSTALGKPIPGSFIILFNTKQQYSPTSQAATDFFTKLRARLGANLPDLAGQSLWYYDYVFLLVDAMKKAGTVDDTNAVANALETVSHDGVLGKVSFDKLHSASHAIDIGFVKNGQFTAYAASPVSAGG
jgi:branched-chain amino acid transport system substrate-binding protein